MMKIRAVFTVATLLFMFSGSKGLAEAAFSSKLNYVALGDSLAEGMTPYGKISESYTNMIADRMKEENGLGSFSKDFAVSGYTTANVLSDMKGNVRRNGTTIRKMIARADIITISAGANDMLKTVRINPAGGSLDYDKEEAEKSLRSAGRNLVEIQKMIQALNPEAKVYVMGYYNSFPYLPKEQQPAVSYLLNDLNHNIQKSTVECGTTFVKTLAEIGEDKRKYLPNPQNIHLSLAGYERVAGQFWQRMQGAVLLPVFGYEEHVKEEQYPNMTVRQRASLQGHSVFKERLIQGH